MVVEVLQRRQAKFIGRGSFVAAEHQRIRVPVDVIQIAKLIILIRERCLQVVSETRRHAAERLLLHFPFVRVNHVGVVAHGAALIQI